ncbi:type III-A CRISPR-associated RAMP protein Csm5, partial [Candidatus Poribacteria bacterium]|nr:type III-A CRISPR-associated RAMP protein Csm5 [Candidatus Poribacteria bacterium]
RMELAFTGGRIRYPKPFIRDGRYRPFIPGTAVKGAIRTAMLYSIIKNDDKKLDDFCSYVDKNLNDVQRRRPRERDKNRIKESFAKKINEDIFMGYSLNQKQKQNGPHTDILRCLKISDSINSPKGLKLEDVMLMSLRGANSRSAYNKNGTILNVECIPPGVNVEFTLSLDMDILKYFQENNKNIPFANLNDIINMIKEFSKAQWDEQEDFFAWVKDSRDVTLEKVWEFYDNGYCPSIRVGWGSGLLGTTIDLLLGRDSTKRLRNLLFTDRRDDEAPKSRRLTVSRVGNQLEAQLPLGWMELKVNHN